MPRKLDRLISDGPLPRRLKFVSNKVPHDIKQGYRVGWWEVLDKDTHHRNKRTGKPSRFYYLVRCVDCGMHTVKSRGELNYAANYYKGHRRCKHDKNRPKDENFKRSIRSCLGRGMTIEQLAAITQLIGAKVPATVVAQQYGISAVSCKRIALDFPQSLRISMLGEKLSRHPWLDNLRKKSEADIDD